MDTTLEDAQFLAVVHQRLFQESGQAPRLDFPCQVHDVQQRGTRPTIRPTLASVSDHSRPQHWRTLVGRNQDTRHAI